MIVAHEDERADDTNYSRHDRRYVHRLIIDHIDIHIFTRSRSPSPDMTPMSIHARLRRAPQVRQQSYDAEYDDGGADGIGAVRACDYATQDDTTIADCRCRA